MKTNYFKKGISALFATIAVFFIVNCSSDDSSGGDDARGAASIVITGSINAFGNVNVLQRLVRLSRSLNNYRLAQGMVFDCYLNMLRYQTAPSSLPVHIRSLNRQGIPRK